MSPIRRSSSGRTEPARPAADRVPGLPDSTPQGGQARRRLPFADAGVAGRIMFANGVMLVGIVLLVTTLLYFVMSEQNDRRAEDQLGNTAESLARSTLVVDHIVSVEAGKDSGDEEPLPVFLSGTPENAEMMDRLDAIRADYEVDLVEVIPRSELERSEGLGGTGVGAANVPEERPAVVTSNSAGDSHARAAVSRLDLEELSEGETRVRYIDGSVDLLVAAAPIMAHPSDADAAAGADWSSSRTPMTRSDTTAASGDAGESAEEPEVVGAAVVGLSPDAVRGGFVPQARTIWLLGGLTVVLGVLANWMTLRGLRRVTGDYGTKELGAVLDYYSSVLRAVSEGLVLVDRSQGVVFFNSEAAELLGMSDQRARTPVPLQDIDLDHSLKALLAEGRYARDEIHYTTRRILVVNQQPASTAPDTWVMTMRDHTELQELIGELVSVRSFSESLRSQTHEYANRLHMIVSLVETGSFDEAVEFATREIEQAERPADNLLDGFDHPVLSALLLTKMSQAAEQGIRMELDTDELRGSITADDRDLVTIVGNLVDNAFDAVSVGTVPPDRRTVRVRFSGAGDSGLVIEVSDDGPGIAEDSLDDVFERGWSTKHDGVAGDTGAGRLEHTSRGVGLSLAVQAVRRMKGAIDVQASGTELVDEAELADMAPPLSGALFTVWVPGAPQEPTHDVMRPLTGDDGAGTPGDLR
ncbi:sensor histidine kinase [Brevibacterium yomogidense]|uniref:Putative two-component sensor kinase n=1 Tax=Brevibacterium yomogidense TaxID=946573 RepID=A0A1X6XCC3_9MICO|nr:ATP-binding protein [Brevibacterium yomogidense]SLM96818.1 putative two-component sensor kinase [Brevibacterium yomogidense]